MTPTNEQTLLLPPDVLPPTRQILPLPPGINASGFRSYSFTRRPDNATHVWFYDDDVLFESVTFDSGITWAEARKSIGCRSGPAQGDEATLAFPIVNRGAFVWVRRALKIPKHRGGFRSGQCG